MPEFRLSQKKGWEWYAAEGIQVRGYAFDPAGELLTGSSLAAYFRDVVAEDDFVTRIRSLNGFFAIIVEGDRTFAAVDRLRSFPLFYHFRKGTYCFTDDGEQLAASGVEADWNELSVQEFRCAGYVTGKETLSRHLFQLPSCSYAVIEEGKLRVETYYVHYSAENSTDSRAVLFETLERMSLRIFKEVIRVADGRQLVVPLSGGYDSRYVLVMLKELGYDNVLTYTYGRRGSYEVETAGRVAEKLNYPWKFVEYNGDKWKAFYNSDHFRDYFRFAGNFTSNPHFQDFIAVEELLAGGDIEKDSVIVPGHSADLLAGKWIPVEVVEKNERVLLKRGLSELIYNTHYVFDQPERKVRKELLEKIVSLLEKDHFNSTGEYIKRYDQWNINERQAKFTVNSLRLFDYFELQWVMPLWDNEFTDFWHCIPLHHKINKTLYHDFLMETWFKKHGVNMVRHRNLTEKSLMSTLKKWLPYAVARPLREIIHYIRSLKQGDHFNAFDDIYLLLYESLAAKGRAPEKRTVNINQVVAAYYLEMMDRGKR